MLVFSNPGEIDIRAATIMGVNVKQGDSPIGYFGTGLKYAIAGIIRLGGTIEIWSGEDNYFFSGKKDNIRNKEFTIIEMTKNASEKSVLGFTIDYGKTWEPWMYYRELYCNTIDEEGQVQLVPDDEEIIPAENLTIIIVKCDKLKDAHLRRDEFILNSAPIIKLPNVEVVKEVNNIYYRGIKVLKKSNAIYGYNLLCETKLTEDRTMAYYWMLEETLAKAFQKCENYDFIKSIISSYNNTLEGSLDWKWEDCGEIFKKAALDLYETQSGRLPLNLYKQIKAEKLQDAPSLPLDEIQQQMLTKAKKFLLLNFGTTITQEIIIAELGNGILGKAEDGKIFLTREAFDQGTKILAGTLWEEYLHITHGFEDESRAFQNYLINKCMSLGELLQKEAL